MSAPSDLFGRVTRGATFSPCRQYRYLLWRELAADIRRTALFLMLNPSKAGALIDDPTVGRCFGFTRAWGYDRFDVANLFAWSATDRSELRRVPEPVGPENDAYILRAAATADLIVCAWGADGALHGRSAHVRTMLVSAGYTLHCLTRTKGGEPGHPLYLRGDLTPQWFAGPQAPE